MSDKSIKPLSTPDNSLNPRINYFDNAGIQVKFNGNSLKLEEVTFTHKQVVSICGHLLLVKILC